MAGRAFTGKSIKLDTTETHRLFLSSAYAEAYPPGTEGAPSLSEFYTQLFCEAMDAFIGPRLAEIKKKAAESELAKIRAEEQAEAEKRAAREAREVELQALLADLDED